MNLTRQRSLASDIRFEEPQANLRYDSQVLCHVIETIREPAVRLH